MTTTTGFGARLLANLSGRREKRGDDRQKMLVPRLSDTTSKIAAIREEAKARVDIVKHISRLRIAAINAEAEARIAELRENDELAPHRADLIARFLDEKNWQFREGGFPNYNLVGDLFYFDIQLSALTVHQIEEILSEIDEVRLGVIKRVYYSGGDKVTYAWKPVE